MRNHVIEAQASRAWPLNVTFFLSRSGWNDEKKKKSLSLYHRSFSAPYAMLLPHELSWRRLARQRADHLAALFSTWTPPRFDVTRLRLARLNGRVGDVTAELALFLPLRGLALLLNDCRLKSWEGGREGREAVAKEEELAKKTTLLSLIAGSLVRPRVSI